MTVSSEVSSVSYSGNGATQIFAVPYYFLADSHLRVILRAADGTETVQAITTNYTVSGAGNQAGGQVTMLVAPPAGVTLVILRNVPATQETDYVANDPFPAESHERALDKLTMLVQQSVFDDGRSIRVPDTDPEPSRLPPTTQRANRVMSFDPSGNPVAVFLAEGPVFTPSIIANVKDFGAVGDGVANDTASIQAALNYVGLNRGIDLIFPAGKYLITSPLVFKPAAVPPALSGSDIHFSEHVESRIYASGDARIIAGAAMSQMLLIQFNSATSSIAPFYTTIQGITFDGANMASEAIRSDFTMHLNIVNNKIWRCTTGIYFVGYGVARIRSNVIKTSICINLAEGGGDSVIAENDFYPLTGGRGVSYGKLSGNSVVTANVFSGEGSTNAYGVYIDGSQYLPSDTVRNIRVTNNEFSGMQSAVFAVRHPSARNVYGIVISGNHTTPAAGGAVHTGALANLTGADDLKITGNYINGIRQAATATAEPGIQLVDCERPIVSGNSFGNLRGPAIYMRDVTRGKFFDNEMQDCGIVGASSAVWDVDTGCTYNRIYENDLYQSNASYAQTPIIERSTSNFNEFLRNTLRGFVNRISKSGAASVLSGRVVAAGAYASSTGGATLYPNSSGFTVTRNSVGVVTVTLSTQRPSANYSVKVTGDTYMTAVDSYSINGFVVRSLNQAGAAQDAAYVQIEVTD